MSARNLSLEPAKDCKVDGIPFDQGKQFTLLEHALGCCSRAPQSAKLEPCPEAIGSGELGSFCAVGSGTSELRRKLREHAVQHLVRPNQNIQINGRFGWPTPCGVLVLVAPQLCTEFFDQKLGPYSDGTLISHLFQRIIVLYCPRDRSLPPGQDMGRVGPSGDLPANLTAIDITPLLEFSQDAVYGAFCSCECLFLIAQLLLGVAPKAALPHALKS